MRDHSKQVRTASGINLILGVWLIISPWVYGYALHENNPTWSSVVVGVLVLIFAALRYNTPHGRTAPSGAAARPSRNITVRRPSGSIRARQSFAN
jgi:hypothetical protein